MPRDEKITQENLNNLRDKSSIVSYGIGSQLDDENKEIQNIIQQTIIDTKQKLGERTNGKPINYFNEINFGNAFSAIFVDKNEKSEAKESKASNAEEFKKYMTNNNQLDVGSLLSEDSRRTIMFNNYRIIHQHIPECAQALNIYKDNITSPDDYTKLIFNLSYDAATSDEEKALVLEKLKALNEKYQLEDKVDDILTEALKLGESYYAVLSLEDELNSMLADPVRTTLNEEAVRVLDKDAVTVPVLSENVQLSNDEIEAFSECFNKDETNLNESELKTGIAQLINENVVIGSSHEMLLEKFEADRDKGKNDIPVGFYKENGSSKKKKKTEDIKPMYLNGSAIRKLDPERVVELRIDNTCYGYYYAEEIVNNIPGASYLGQTSGRSVTGTMSLAQNGTLSSNTSTEYSPMTGAASQLGIGEQKLRLISDVFLNAISKKIDKDFIRKNKEFKDFIYDLVRQDFIIKKGLKLTYFKPDEVIKFECDSIYKDITFFAKLYLSILTNNLLIKLGRAHDKRVFYVNVGADAAYEQAIQSVIEDVKTKDYKMEQLNDFNTVLNLTPGRFDDYYMPTINGERPVEIETLPGMDVDMNNDFVEYLKNSMMSGMGVPRNLIDVTSDVDYARSISAMNANFVRSVIKYQKKFTAPFTRMYQILFRNEYRYINDQENTTSTVNISAIHVNFPSPATLVMNNISEQIQAVDQNADFIASQLIPLKQDGSTEDQRVKLKTAIVKDLLPTIDWSKYEAMVDDMKRENEKEKIEQKAVPAPDPMADPYGGGYGAY